LDELEIEKFKGSKIMKYVTKMLKGERGLQSLDRKELLIAYLYALHLEGKELLSEYELASFTYFAQITLPFKYKFLTKPIPYSYDLLGDVESLRSMAYLEAQIEIIGGESIPKYSYSLTLLGKIKAKEIYDALPEEDKLKIKDAIDRTKLSFYFESKARASASQVRSQII
jgi:hypothetical protein